VTPTGRSKSDGGNGGHGGDDCDDGSAPTPTENRGRANTKKRKRRPRPPPHHEHEHECRTKNTNESNNRRLQPRREQHHPLSVYRHKAIIDFEELASKSPLFASAWKAVKDRQKEASSARQQLSSHVNNDFNVALTRALLQQDFNLELPSMPSGYLCPPVPNRLNYVCWIQELLQDGFKADDDIHDTPTTSTCLFMNEDGIHSRQKTDTHYDPPPRHYRGIDIGTGASCIYPLLLARQLMSMNMNLKSNSASFQINRSNNQSSESVSGSVDKECNGKPMACKWKFLATDIDPVAVQSARANVAANQMQDTIQVSLVSRTAKNDSASSSTSYLIKHGSKDDATTNISGSVCKDSSKTVVVASPPQCNSHSNSSDTAAAPTSNGPLMTAIQAVHQDQGSNTEHSNNAMAPPDKQVHAYNHPQFDFCMTNPPFYSSEEDARSARSGDGRERADMTLNEGVYEGGEVAFVSDIIQDSLQLQLLLHQHDNTMTSTSSTSTGTCTWYTSMVGHKSSLAILKKQLLYEHGLGLFASRGNVRTTEFVQGQTSRWGIAWSFCPMPSRLLGKYFFVLLLLCSCLFQMNAYYDPFITVAFCSAAKRSCTRRVSSYVRRTIISQSQGSRWVSKKEYESSEPNV
jgi:23S rRNA A1618 N6-methylase RlmF